MLLRLHRLARISARSSYSFANAVKSIRILARPSLRLAHTRSRSSPTATAMAAPASASAASSTTAATASSPSPAAPHVALDFFDSHPASFVNLMRSPQEQSWLETGRAQLAALLGLEGAARVAGVEADPAAIERLPPGGTLPSAEEEQAEVEEFVRWASGPAKALVRLVAEELPRAAYASPDAKDDALGRLVSRVEMLDFSPAGRVDDEVFAKHRDVWERITRGCAVLRLHPSAAAPAGSQPMLRWAVRANRKFTGAEDDAQADGALYTVTNSAGPADRVVVTHKCNGSVLHLSARDLTLWGQGSPVRFVFLGSKKVHVGAVWTAGGAQEWAGRVALYKAERHQVVGEMLRFVVPRLADAQRSGAMLALLARARLVINAEYVSSIGTGPTDNERIYGLLPAAREAFGFMLSCNTLRPPPALSLGVEPMYGLWLLRSWGFATVAAFAVPLSQLDSHKAGIIPLPDVEGAVLYYANREGLLQLEKWKSSGYVIVRAVREKLRPFIFGNKAYPGLESLVSAADKERQGDSALRVAKVAWTAEQLAAQAAAAAGGEVKQPKRSGKNKRKEKAAAAKAQEGAASAAAAAAIESLAADSDGSDGAAVAPAPAPAPASAPASASASSSPSPAEGAPQVFLEFSHPQLDAAGSALTALGLRKVPGAQQAAQCTWRVACPASSAGEAALRAAVDSAYALAVLQRPVTVALALATEKVAGRIRAINHIPLSEAERAQWLADSAAFLQWLTAQLAVHRRWQPREVMNQYSKLWTLFREERALLSHGATDACDQLVAPPKPAAAAVAASSSS